jgi:class 3 adenylate cyclase
MQEEISAAEIGKRFHRDYILNYRRAGQIAIICGALLFGAFAVWDWALLPKEMLPDTLHFTALLRAGTMLALFALAMLLEVPSLQKYQEWVIAAAILLAGMMMAAIYSYIPRAFNYGVAGMVLLIMFAATVAPFRLRFYVATVAIIAVNFIGSSTLLVKNAFQSFAQAGAASILVANCLFVVSAALLGGIAVWWRQREAKLGVVDDILLERQKERIEDLLYSVIPQPLVERIERGESPIADSYGEVTIVFADLVGFTELAGRIGPRHLVEMLNRIFGEFDQLASEHGLDRIKTVGDAYMAVGGITTRANRDHHCIAAARFAIAAQGVINSVAAELGYPVSMRVGLHIGPIVAGVIGSKRPAFDCWGEAVNLASRLETAAGAGCILVSEQAYYRLKDHFNVVMFDDLSLKGIGVKQAFLLHPREGEEAQVPAAASGDPAVLH